MARTTSDPARASAAQAWIHNTLAAAAIGVLQLGVAISLAALIFSGPLSPGAGRAAAGFVLGTAIVSAVVGLTSAMPIVIAGAQDTAAIVVAAVAASIVAAPEVSLDERVPTVIVMIALSTLVTGAMFWVLGRYGLSSFVRFLPTPVISGFTAGTGWLLLRGGVEVMHGSTLTGDSLVDLLAWENGKFLLPGLALAAVMVCVIMTRLTNTLVSIVILGGAGVFHLVGRSVSSAATMEQQGWLIGPFPDDASWAPIRPSDLGATNWGILVDHTLPIAAIVTVSVIGMLLNLSSLESVIDSEVDMNRELRATGFANLAAGLGGGLIGYHLLGDTVLARQLRARGRAAPLIITAMAGAAFVAGTDLIALMPRAVAGGVLAGLGITMLVEWARTALARMTRSDRTLSSLILAIIAILGVLPGVGAGVLIAAGVFVVKYSLIDPVRHTIDAAGQSNVDRHERERQLLAEARGSILAFELQGYLFFGSTIKLRAAIEQQVHEGALEARVAHDTPVRCEYVIIDFARVTGVDSTASSGLAAIASRLADLDILTVASGLHDDIGHELGRNGVRFARPHPDIDHAISWCEDHLLAQLVYDIDPTETASGPPLDPILMQVMQRRDLEPGDVLIDAGAQDRDLYFVESGKLTAWIHFDDGRQRRIRQVLPGAALGEIAFCTGGPRTATVIADTPAVVRVLRRSHFDELARTQPDIAVRIQDDLLARMGQRVSSTSKMVRDLMR